ncbi:MAG TPA: copper homeostasis periplasmic binding protein CopC [Stellaceae bacterium]|nr:copper homeostasis periplasmic binding protein CopC [Stellaceae bacterium]
MVSVILAGTALCTGIPAAMAHARLDHAVPAAQSTVHVPPTKLQLWFTEDLEPSFSTIAVLDSQGRHVEQGQAKADSAHTKLLEIGLEPLPPGTYTVVWHVTAVDSHRTEGKFIFTVAPS